jgi:putative hydrolases of HD superfamily
MPNKKRGVDLKAIAKLFFEFGQLRRTRHMGYTLNGVEVPENIAEHTARTAQIGYVLAKLEGADADKVLKICVFHDLGEARVNDTNRVATRYYDYKELKKVEKIAFSEQISVLPKNAREELNILLGEEFGDRKSLEARCAKDADYVDLAVAAKEYADIGYKGCLEMIQNVKKALHTKSAKELVEIIEKTDRNEWWYGLKNFKGVIEK